MTTTKVKIKIKIVGQIENVIDIQPVALQFVTIA